MSSRARRRLDVSGVVQGVGFRPFVFRLATEHGLGGFVQNVSGGLQIEVEGEASVVEGFARRLQGDAPPLARVTRLVATALAVAGDGAAFEIRPSGVEGSGRSWLPPDVGPCDACLRELHSFEARRAGHAFISCTACGPRYSIVEALPFDRARTSMSDMAMCADCRREFETPDDRRFHAQTIACRACGPRLAFASRGGGTAEGDAARHAAADVLAAGGIVAVKGVGAYHLLCDATRDDVVAELRRRKGRPDKPLAVLVPDLAAAERLVSLSDVGRVALTSPSRPIVVAPALGALASPAPASVLAEAIVSDLAPNVARDAPGLGVALPPSPLHVVLAEAWRACRGGAVVPALVMTSANASDQPAIVDDVQARSALDGIADAWLSHDRRIAARCDDAVMADAGSAGIIPVRLGRGTSPAPLPMPHAGRPILAVGGEFKAACCLAFDGHAVMSPHLGDMSDAATLDAMAETVNHLCGLLRVEPEIVVCDAHPGYLSSRWADAAAGGRAVRVQHHHAHAASLMAEHGLALDRRLVTVCFDGTGYGDDGAIWGGEVLDAGYSDARRLAHLAYAPLPGGDAAIRHPARAAYAYLRHAGIADADALPCGRALGASERRLLAQQVEQGRHVTPTSSIGRLFDVVAAVCGVAATCSYEGQAAMALEAAAATADAVASPRSPSRYRFEWDVGDGRGPLAIRWTSLLREIAADVRRGQPNPAIAAAFHEALADAVVGVVRTVAPDASRVGLTGGVFQNVRLLRLVADRLRAHGAAALTHRLVPPNDGGLSLGQAAVAAARLGR